MVKVIVDRAAQNKVIVRLANLKDGLPRESAVAMINVAKEVRDEAKRIVLDNAYDTGSLYRSLRLLVMASPAKNIRKIGVSAGGYVTNPKTGRKVDYAGYVEFGTSRNRPVPFLRVAAAIKMRKMILACERAIFETSRRRGPMLSSFS